MHILADENIPRPVIHRLREAGFEVISMQETGAGTLDPQVLERAGGALLLTSDRDFGNLVYA